MSSFKTLGFFFLSLSLLFSSLLVLLSLLLFAGLLLFPSLLPFSRFLPFAGFSPASGFSLATKYDEGFSGNVSYRGISMTARKRTHCGFHYLRYHLFNRLLLN